MINKKQSIELIIAATLAVVLSVLIRVTLLQTFEVTNKSMNPTFVEGDKVLVLKHSSVFNKINRFDVIVIKDQVSNVNLIKRVVGIGGDSIKIKDERLYINGVIMEHSMYSFKKRENAYYEVPSGEFFVLGDNVLFSEDSRHFGFIKKENILGRVFLIFNPHDHFKFFKRKQKMMSIKKSDVKENKQSKDNELKNNLLEISPI